MQRKRNEMHYRIAGEIARRSQQQFGIAKNPNLFQWSRWSIKRHCGGPEQDWHTLVCTGVSIAYAAMRRIGAMQSRRSESSPLQPRVRDLVPIVQVFGMDARSAVVAPLRTMAERFAAECNARGIVIRLWAGGCANLSNGLFAFRVLARGVATAIADGLDVRELLGAGTPLPVLRLAIGRSHSDLLDAISRGAMGRFSNGAAILRSRSPVLG